VVIEGRFREVVIDDYCTMCSIKPDFGSQVCIDKHVANLVHDGEVESLSHSSCFRAVSIGNLMTDSLVEWKVLQYFYFAVLGSIVHQIDQ